MMRRVSISLFVFLIAFGVLFISIFRTASVKYEFSGPVDNSYRVLGDSDVSIDYEMPFPGKVLPDSPLWPLKALRDRIWLWTTTNQARKAELLLLFADKRIASAKIFFENEKYEEGYTILTKAEKYLEQASNKEEESRKKGNVNKEFLNQLARASLKHYLIMEEMIEMSPEDAGPKIIETQQYAKRVYERSRNALLGEGEQPPENPFDWR
jgi:hypothetical protein